MIGVPSATASTVGNPSSLGGVGHRFGSATIVPSGHRYHGSSGTTVIVAERDAPSYPVLFAVTANRNDSGSAIEASASRVKVARSAALPFVALGRRRAGSELSTRTDASWTGAPSWSRTAMRTGTASPGRTS